MRYEYWENSRGDAVVLLGIQSQPDDVQNKVLWVLDRLNEVGLMIGESHLKKFEGYDSLYELKAKQYRILFAVIHGKAHLVHSFVKGSNDTKKRHIKTAVKRAKLIE